MSLSLAAEYPGQGSVINIEAQPKSLGSREAFLSKKKSMN
jgi:hypothetical protein